MTVQDFDDIKIQLPFGRVRGICQLIPELEMINPEAVKLIAKATEYFVEELVSTSYTQAVLDKRKTVQKKDIDKVIESNPVFELLEDALDDWLEDVADKTIEEETENGIEADSSAVVVPHEDGADAEEMDQTEPITESNEANPSTYEW